MVEKLAMQAKNGKLKHAVGYRWISQWSNEQNIGWLRYIGDSTSQLYRDYYNPL